MGTAGRLPGVPGAFAPATAFLAATGIALPAGIPDGASAAATAGLWFAFDLGLRGQAARRRRDRAHAFISCLQLRPARTTGAGISEVLEYAARIGDGWGSTGSPRSWTAPGVPRGAAFGSLADVIYNRDLWMHRVDIARATGKPLAATAAGAGVVAQVVRNLDRGWARPAFMLTLTGHAGAWQIAGQPGRRAYRRRGQRVPAAVGTPGRAGPSQPSVTAG